MRVRLRVRVRVRVSDLGSFEDCVERGFDQTGKAETVNVLPIKLGLRLVLVLVLVLQ